MNTSSPSSSSQYRQIISGGVIGNRYLIKSILRQGEFGCTYLAVDSYRFYEPCVLQEFNLTFTDINDEVRKKLHYLVKQEVEGLYQLDHCQITKILAYFPQKERFFLVQEYIQGKSYAQLLQQRIQRGQTFKEAEIISWLINLLLVLEYIHARGIIHRDISPQNIIQSDESNLPILINFGVGQQSISLLKKEYQNLPNSIDSFSSSIRVTKSFANKIGYVPYEQIKLGLAFPCSDLYALGVTAVVLLTGKQPISLVDRNTLEWRWHSCTKVSESFTRIINKLLAYNPKHRYQSAREVLNELEPLQQTTHLPFQEVSLPETKVIGENYNPTQLTNTRRWVQEETTDTLGTLSSSQPASLTYHSYSPSPQFIQICQQKLAYYIGPIANLIIEEVLDSRICLSNKEFIRAIATEIPDWQQSLEFQQAIQTEINLLT